ncbi:hypothetical protein [Vibrio phage phiKT1019]|nr:hypothetical protein [Vibrio phage phiKT1019]
MNAIVKWFQSLNRKKEKPFDLVTAQKEIDRVRTLLKPSSQTPLNEILHTLYNFSEKSVYEFVEDFPVLKREVIKMHSESSLKLAQLTSEGLDHPFNRVMVQYEINVGVREEKPVLNWYSNQDTITLFLADMQTWCQIGVRVHYERFGGDFPGDYDKPVTQNQKDFVFSSVFVKVINDYVELLDLILRTQPRGTDLDQTNQPQR